MVKIWEKMHFEGDLCYFAFSMNQSQLGCSINSDKDNDSSSKIDHVHHI